MYPISSHQKVYDDYTPKINMLKLGVSIVQVTKLSSVGNFLWFQGHSFHLNHFSSLSLCFLEVHHGSSFDPQTQHQAEKPQQDKNLLMS